MSDELKPKSITQDKLQLFGLFFFPTNSFAPTHNSSVSQPIDSKHKKGRQLYLVKIRIIAFLILKFFLLLKYVCQRIRLGGSLRALLIKKRCLVVMLSLVDLSGLWADIICCSSGGRVTWSHWKLLKFIENLEQFCGGFAAGVTFHLLTRTEEPPTGVCGLPADTIEPIFVFSSFLLF